MKPIVFLFLFITSSISYAEWEFYSDSKTGNGKYFYYNKNIKRIKGEVYFWQKYIRNETSLFEVPTWKRANSFRAYRKINCKIGYAETLEESRYRDTEMKDEIRTVTYLEQKYLQRRYIFPESIIGKLADKLCNR